MKEYSELHIKNNNTKYIDGANWILLTLATRSLLAADVAFVLKIVLSEVKVGKIKVKKMKRKNLRTVMKQLGASFVKLLKFILSQEEKNIQQQT